MDAPSLRDMPSGCGFFTGPWTVTRSPLRMLRWVAAFCRPLRPVLLLVSFPRSRSPAVGVPGLCGMWRDVPFACQWRPIVGATPPSHRKTENRTGDAALMTGVPHGRLSLTHPLSLHKPHILSSTDATSQLDIPV